MAAAVASIPPGTVATYGEVAVEAGFAVGASRAVGNVLQRVDGLPWWRVVTAGGRLVPGLEDRHAQLLRAEGVEIVDGRVRLRARRPPRSAPGGRQHGRAEGGPRLEGPGPERPVAEHGTGDAGLGVDPAEAAGPAEVTERRR